METFPLVRQLPILWTLSLPQRNRDVVSVVLVLFLASVLQKRLRALVLLEVTIGTEIVLVMVSASLTLHLVPALL